MSQSPRRRASSIWPALFAICLALAPVMFVGAHTLAVNARTTIASPSRGRLLIHHPGVRPVGPVAKAIPPATGSASGLHYALESAASATGFDLLGFARLADEAWEVNPFEPFAPMMLQARAPGAAAAANAGLPQTVPLGGAVHLDGSKSTSGSGLPLSFHWSFTSAPAGSAASFSDPSAVNPTFVADVAGDYGVQLTVNDGNTSSSAAVAVSTVNAPPMANAGPPQTVATGSTVTLDGSGSFDPDGDALTFAWSLTSRPNGSAAVLSSASAVSPAFTVDVAGSYTAQLVVADGHAHTSTASVTVSTSNPVPVANAGANRTVAAGTAAQLDATASYDPDGDALTFAWNFTYLPAGSAAVLLAPSSATPTFTPDVAGTYVAQVTVSDPGGQSASATVSINTQNSAPVANAGAPQSVPHGSSVQLDGTGSSDPDANPLSFAWALIGKPSGSTAALTGASTATPTFVADLAGQYLAQLTVSDGTLSNSSSVLITATNAVAKVAPAAINFGNQPIQVVSAARPVVITNTTSSPIIVEALTLSGTGATQFQVGSPGASISPGGSASVNVSFAPQALGASSAALAIAFNAGPSVSVALGGVGVPQPSINYSPGSIVFGNQGVNTASASSRVTVSNVGAGVLALKSLTLAGANPGDFSVKAAATPLNLVSGASTPIDVTFTPTASGGRSALLIVGDNAPGSPHIINLSGTGTAPAITFSPSSLNFPDTAIGATSTALPVTVGNPGASSISISALAIAGANSGDFVLQTSAPITIAPGSNATVNVAFKPSGSGARAASLQFTDNVAGSPQSVSLSGNGVVQNTIAANPSPLAFGNVPVGTASPGSVTLNNISSNPVTVTSLTIAGPNAADFGVGAAGLPINLAAGASSSVPVTFTPGGSGARGASLAVAFNAPGSPLNVPLTGTGTAPAASLNPTALNFGNQLVGAASAPQNVTIKNSGNTNLVVSGISFSGAAAADYAVGGFTPQTLAPNASLTVSVTLTPSAAGTRAALLAFNDNASDTPQQVALTGNGTAPNVVLNPTSVNFANQKVGTTSQATSVTVSNTGTANLVITALPISGTNPGDFVAASSPLPLTVAPNTSTVITVAFTPAASGTRTAALGLTDNAPGGGAGQSIPLSGTGTSGGNTTVSISPTSVDFGSVPLQSTAAAKNIVISNSGGANLVITSAVLSGPNAGDFAFTLGPLPMTVSSGGIVVMSATFTPSAIGPRSATLTLTDNADTSPQVITLTGSGQGTPIIGFNGANFDFGNQNVGTTSAPLSITISNSGTDNLVISNITLSSFNAAEFALLNAATPLTVAPATSKTIQVTFTPGGTGARSATLKFNDNAANSPQSINLTGNGTLAVLNVSPTSLDFGSVALSTTSAAKMVTLTNQGSGPLSVSSITLGGANPGDFAFSASQTPITVQAGASANVMVTFAPTATGARSATLNLVYNGTGSPQSVTLTGNGTQTGPAITLTPPSVSFGSQPVGTTTAATPVTISNPGNQSLIISQLAISGANVSDFSFGQLQLPLTVSAGASAVVQVAFTPSASGARAASLVVTHNAPGSPSSVPLSGTGTAPQITVTPTSIDFGTQNLNTTSTAMVVTVTNTGTAPATVSNAMISGANASSFSVSSTGIPAVLAAGQSLKLNLTFTPLATAPAPLTATLSIAHNAAGSPAQVALQGTGVGSSGTVGLSPGSLNFPSTAVNAASTPISVVVSNNGGTSLVISNLSFTGANASDFSVSSKTPITVFPSSSVAVPVTLTPSAAGARSAVLNITDSAAGSPHLVPVSGTGTINGPSISLPASLDFGNQLVSTASASQAINIANPGTQTLSITAISVSGANPGDFTISGFSSPLTIAAGGSAKLNAFFNPGAPGARSATLTLTDNSSSPASPQTVNLTGFGTHPVIGLSANAIDFGSQQALTTSSPVTLTISNSGDGNLVITGLAVTPSQFQLTAGALPITVAPGTNASVTLTFAPSQSTQYNGSLTITDNASGSPQVVTLAGTGTAASISLNPSPVNFGNQGVGITSPVTNVTVTNTGAASLVISNLTLTGANVTDFAFSSSPLPITVGANGGSATVGITFTPSNTGTRTASLTFTDNVAGSPQTLLISGVGQTVQPPFSPSAVNFNPQQINTTSAPITVTATNSTNTSLVISGITINGANPGDFAITPSNAPLTVPANSSTTFQVTFAPSALGARSANLAFTDNFPGSPHILPLSGTATAGPSLGISPPSLTFAGQDLGTTSAPMVINLSNNGSNNLSISNIAVTGPQAAEFSVSSGTLPINLPNSATASLTVTFTPAALGTRAATIVLTDNSAGSPHSIQISGAGLGVAQASLSGSTIDFGSQRVAQTSAPSSLVVTNNGTANLVITNLVLGGTNPGDFAIPSANLPITVAPQASATINLTFTPAAGGARSATLSLADNATGSPQIVNLTGSGIAPGVNLSATTLNFGNQQVNVASTPQALTVTNNGTADLVISVINVTGPQAAEFAVTSGPAPITVHAGGSTAINLVLTPQSTGTRSATLNIMDNAAGSPRAVALTGNGVVPNMVISPAPPFSFGTVLVNTTSPAQTINVLNNGSGPLVITAVTLSGANPGDFGFSAPQLPITIAPSGATQLTATFAPTAGGARAANLVLTSNASDSPRSLALTGNGNSVPGLSFTPSTLTFPNQMVNTASAPITETLTNTGTADLVITGFSITGAQASDFSATPAAQLPITVPAGQTTTVSLAFTPAATGARAGNLVVASNAQNSPSSLSLAGNGIGLAGFSAPATVNFGNQLLGATSGPIPLAISNNGTSDLVITNIVLGGTNALDFTLTPVNFPLVVSSGKSANLTLTFKPGALGARNGTLTFTDNAAGSPQVIGLQGAGAAPAISASPTSVDFGQQLVGVVAPTQTITVTNSGTAPLTISSIAWSGANASEFIITTATQTPITVQPGANTVLTVKFTPAGLGPRTATLNINHNAAGAVLSVPLAGTGVSPTLTLQPASLTFTNTVVNSASQPLSAQIQNTGTGTLTVSSLVLDGVNPSDFSFTSSSQTPISIAAGASATVSVTFTPTATGSRSAILRISDNSSGSPHALQLLGTGTQSSVAVNPSPANFGSQLLNSTTPKSITVTNNGTANLSITALAIGGANSDQFSVIQPPQFPITVPPNQTTNITVNYVPTTQGNVSGTLIITDNAAGSPQSVTLTGVGTAPVFAIDKTSVNFGNQLQGVASSSIPVTVSNTGNGNLNISGLVISGPNAADFSFTSSQLPISVAPQFTAAINVVFNPSATGPRSATLTITDNASGSPQAVTLSGNGVAPALSLSATALSFPDQLAGVTSSALPVTLTNNGTGNLNITSLTLGGANPGDFSFGNVSAPATVAPNGGTLTLNVTFTPAASGQRAATISLVDNATGSPQLITLSGKGTAPGISFSPNPVTFAAQNIGSASAPTPVTVTNTGTGPLQINGISTGGANAGDFSVTAGAFPIPVAAGASTTVNVTFTPQGAGPRAGTLVFNDNVPGSPQSLTLSGTGQGAALVLTPTPPLNFGSQPVNTNSSVHTVTVNNTGNATLQVTAVSISGPNASEFLLGSPTSFSVASSGSSGISLIYRPTTSGETSTATLNIVDNAAGSPHTYALQGQASGNCSLSLLPIAVGNNLEVLATVSLVSGSNTCTQSTDVNVTVQSSNSSLVALSSDSTGATAGGQTVSLTISAGSSAAFPGFWVQGNGSSGNVTLTASATGMTNVTNTVTLSPSGFQISGPNGLGADFSATVGAPDTTLTVSAVRLDSSNNVQSGAGRIRGGASVTVPIAVCTNLGAGNCPSPSGVGSIVGAATIAGGSTNTVAASFHASATGVATISVVPPSGFNLPNAGTQMNATVLAPAININPVLAGANLQVTGIGTLTSPAPASGLQVTITSQTPSVVQLSTDPMAAPSTSIVLNVPGNSSSLPTFLVYGMAVGSGQLTASANGYAFSTAGSNGAVSITPSGFLVAGPGGNPGQAFSTTTISAASTLTITVVREDNSGNPVSAGFLRGGIGSVSVNVSTDNPSVGSILNGPAVFTSDTQSVSNLNFQPNGPGTTNITASAAGFSTPNTGGSVAATVSQPQIQFSLATSNVGINLELTASGKLTGPAPSPNLQVTITSNDPNVVLSTDPTLPGASSITVTVPAGEGQNGLDFPSFYVQALGTAAVNEQATLTASGPGFQSATATITVTPSAFTLTSTNGLGQDFATTGSQGASALSVASMQLSAGLTPQTQQAVRGGLTLAVSVNSSNSSVGVVGDSPTTFTGGVASQLVHFSPGQSGTSLLSIPTPSGFSTANPGASLHVTVN